MNASLAANFSRTAICENRSPIPECIGFNFESLFYGGVFSDGKYLTWKYFGISEKNCMRLLQKAYFQLKVKHFKGQDVQDVQDVQYYKLGNIILPQTLDEYIKLFR